MENEEVPSNRTQELCDKYCNPFHMCYSQLLIVSPAKHSGTKESPCPESVCPCVCLSGSHTFLVVTHSYVSRAVHAFLGMLPLFLFVFRFL